jgi:hypothetical protein
MPGPDGPDVAAAKRLLDAAKRVGFAFQRVAPGEDGPLFGVRETLTYRDTCYLGGFSTGCSATRSRKSSLVTPSGSLITARVDGDALTVLHTVLSDWCPGQADESEPSDT